MAKVKISEFRGMDENTLNITLRDIEKELFDLRFQSATDRLETKSEIRKARRNIARIKTLQRERQLAAEKKGATNG
jgi:large subunit ribosomal protein L29